MEKEASTTEQRGKVRQQGKERLQTQRELKLDKLKTLKADAESLKQSLSSFKSERAKHDPKQELHNEDKLYELVAASGVSMDKDVLEQIIELLRLNVNPDKLYDVFQVLTRLEKDFEMVSII